MEYIKFDTIDSTNDFLKSLAQTRDFDDFFYISTDFQTKGRGQRTNIWQSECCKNVLMSIFLHPPWNLKQQAVLNQMVSVSIVSVLQKFNIPGLRIKQPNDIMSGDKKIGGILIENVIAKNRWKQSIIGIGLNVNQTNFVNLPHACSMKSLTGKDYKVDLIIDELITELKKHHKHPAEKLQEAYEALLIP